MPKPVHLPQLDDLPSPKSQLHFIYKPKDARKIQSLDPVFTLEDLRRTGVVGSRVIQSSLAYPGLNANFLNEPADGVNSDDERDDFDDAGSEGRSMSEAPGKAHGKAAQRSPSPDQSSGRNSPLRYNATAAARAMLLHEKPAVVERMEKGVAACAVLRDNRRFRLFSLGVFQPAVNDVRTRSMHRVELHKHLSSTNLRAPQPDKEVRSAVHADTVGARLERLYHKVLRTGLDDSAPPSPGLGMGYGLLGSTGGFGASGTLGSSAPGGGFGGTGGRRPSPPGMVPFARAGSNRRLPGEAPPLGQPAAVGPGGSSSATELAQRHSPLVRNASLLNRNSGPAGSSAGGGGGGAGNGGGGGPGSRMLLSIPSMGRAGASQQQPGSLQPPGSPNANGNGGASGTNTQRTAHSSDYWMRVTLPPEVIEAQLRHLAASTEANLRAYHDKVAAAQDELLRCNGLNREALQMAPELMEQSLKVKLGQIQEDTINNFNYSCLSREAVLASHLGPASKQLLTATTLPQFIRAALDHVTQHAGELATLRATGQRPEDGRRRSIHRRARAKSTVTAIPTAYAAASSSTVSAIDSSRTISSEATATGDGGESSTQEGSSESGVWPSYMNVRQRAVSAGSPTVGGGGGSQGAASGGGSKAGEHSRSRISQEDANSQHLEHLRRHASPDSSAHEPRWSPPPVVLVGNVRAQTAPAPLLVAAPPQQQQAGGRKSAGAFIDDAWMDKFYEELRGVEQASLDSPPEGLLPLPSLPPGSMDAGAYVRCRLERLWTLLDMPPTQRLDLVLAFTGKDRALQFARNLELWEQAAMAVLGREAQVEALVAAQREIEAGRADLLSLGAIGELCARVLRQTRWVEELSARLREACGWSLSYHGKPYPGSEAITSNHLLAFMEQLRQVTQITGLKP